MEVINPAPSDEVRIYFDGGNQYAYFQFSTVEDGNYTPPATGYFYPDDRSEEGQMGIFDGTQRVGHNSWSCEAVSNGSGWFALWIRSSEDGSKQVATAILGGNARMGGRGPGYISDVAEAYVSVSNPDVGIGSGQITTGRTFIDKVSVSESSRSWSYNWGLQNGGLTPDDCSYSLNTIPTFKDFWGQCWGAGLDNQNCVDGIPPSEIHISIAGVHSGQNTDDTQPFYSDPPCNDCNSLNGTYVLTRNDICIDAGCDGYDYVYYGSCGCGDFTIGLAFYPNATWNRPPYTGYGVNFIIVPCHAPIWQNCTAGPWSNQTGGYYGSTNITASGIYGLLDCLGNDLIGANASITILWQSTWNNPGACFEGTITISGVA